MTEDISKTSGKRWLIFTFEHNQQSKKPIKTPSAKSANCNFRHNLPRQKQR
jgi:hypothetical protein